MLVLLALLLGIVLSEDCNHFYDVPLDECAYSTVYSYDWDTTSYSTEYSYGYYCNYNETEDEYFVDYVYYDVEDCNGDGEVWYSIPCDEDWDCYCEGSTDDCNIVTYCYNLYIDL